MGAKMDDEQLGSVIEQLDTEGDGEIDFVDLLSWYYIQKHGRTTVLLQGRGHVRQDNDPSFFMCARCGHDACTPRRTAGLQLHTVWPPAPRPYNMDALDRRLGKTDAHDARLSGR